MLQNKNKLINLCEKISLVLFCIVMFDACVFGAGSVVNLGPISFRQFFLLLLGLSCIPLLFINFKQLLKNKFLLTILAFFLWLAVCTVIGIKNQNPLVFIDLNGFLYLIFVPLAFVVLNSKEKLHKVMKTMIWGSATLAVIVIAHLILYLINTEMFLKLAEFEMAHHVARIAPISKSIPRIYMLSGLYMISGCAFSIYFLTFETKFKNRLLYILVVAISLFSLLISYTRSIYAGVILSASTVFIYFLISVPKKERVKLVANICACVILFIGIGGTFSLFAGTNYIQYAFSRSTVGIVENPPVFPSIENPDDNTPDDSDKNDNKDDKNDDKDADNALDEFLEKEELDYYNTITKNSDELRAITINESIEHIKKSPIIGHGLGFTTPSRPDGNEYSYLDIILKLGVIGLVLYFLPFVFILINIFKTQSDAIFSRKTKIVWLAVLIGIMVYSMFNPYINSALGIFIYGCTMAISQNKINIKTKLKEC